MRAIGAACLLLPLLLSHAQAQGFGQNRVIMRDFEWKVRSTEHFDIHYYEGSAPLVPRTAEILEGAYERVSKDLDITVTLSTGAGKNKGLPLWTRRPFFLYASPNDFHQTNIVPAGEGTGGVTEPFKDRFLVYNDGTLNWLEEVITHEFTHVMQYYVLVSGFWKSGRILKSIIYPLWMMEGMAGWTTKPIEETLEEVVVRDAATSGGLLPLTRLERFGHLKPHQVTLAYKEGAAAMDFLSQQYGPKKVAEFLKLFDSRFETSAALAELVGLDAFQFDRKFREYLEDKYARVARVERLWEPSAYGDALTFSDDIPQFNSSPVFTSDGKKMFYLSTRRGHPAELYEKDMRTGRRRRLVTVGRSGVESTMLGNFANLSRVLALSPDGRSLVFVATKLHSDGLYFYDLKTRKLERRELPGFMKAAQPQFSPDGGVVAFSGMKNSTTDIYLYDVRTRRISAVTADPQDDEMPAFTPDGGALIYSSEWVDPLDRYHILRRLYRVDLKSRETLRLEDTADSARDPIVSPDGKKVLYIAEGGGFSEICELDLEGGRVNRLTRTVGGMFTPVYVGDQIAFASMRRGSVHLYVGSRGNFLSEEVPQRKGSPSNNEKFLFPGMGGVWPSRSSIALSPERPYRFSASTDLFLPALFYSSPGGLFMTTYWQGSDMLGNHQAASAVSYSSYRSYFDYAASYSYGRYRPQLSVGAIGRGARDLFSFDRQVEYNEGLHAQFVGVSYPLNRYHRLETQIASVSDKIVFHDARIAPQSLQSRLLSYGFVRDTTNGRYLVATRGNRLNVSVAQGLDLFGGNQEFQTLAVEGHQFIEMGSQSSLALRALEVQSIGRDHPTYALGGIGGVRGYVRSSVKNAGNHLALLNAEYRFPLIKNLNYYMWYFFPDFYFKEVFGSIFTDVGYAWNQSRDTANLHWRDLRNSIGAGVSVYTFILQEFLFTVTVDYARRTTEKGDAVYVYLGTIF